MHGGTFITTLTLRGPRASTLLTSFAIALPIAITESTRLKTNIFLIVVKFLKGCTLSLFLIQSYNPKLRFGVDMSVKRLKPLLKRLFGEVNRLQPLFEIRYSRLRYYYSLGSIDHQVERKAATKPHGDILHGLA